MAIHPLLFARADVLDCTTQYSGDYYGFGVRMGVYFAWLSSYLANTFLQSEISGSLDTNSFFLLALLISLFRGTLTNELYQVDGLISMHLSSGFIFSSLSIWGYRSLNYAKEGSKAIYYFGGFGTHSRLALTTAISVYGTWFWWRGVDGGLLLAENPECQVIWTWFFHSWPILRGVNKLYIIMTIGCSLYFSCMCAVAFVSIIYRLFKFKKRQSIRFETGYNAQELRFLFKFFRIFSILYIIFSMFMVELTLNANNMHSSLPQAGNVGSPAQLLPLNIGIFSFIRVLFLLYVDKTGHFGEIWRFDALDYGRHPHVEEREVTGRTIKIFGIKLNGLMAPAMLSRRARTEDFEAHMAERQARPWYKRVLVGFLPWLSVFELWQRMPAESIRDVEESRERSVEDHKEDVKTA